MCLYDFIFKILKYPTYIQVSFTNEVDLDFPKTYIFLSLLLETKLN